jgi:hypothetical protein
MSEAEQEASDPQSTGEVSGSSRIPPYIPFSTFLTFLDELKTNGIPPQIDNSVLRRFSGSAQAQLKQGMRAINLLDGAKPTAALERLVNAYKTEEFDGALGELLRANYPYVFALDLMNATPQMFADAFDVTGAKADVARKCRTFFLYAAKAAGIPLGQRILTGSVSKPANGSARKKKAKAPEPQFEAPPPPKPKADDDDDAKGKNHPLVKGLLMTLPEPGKPWPVEGRASWLRMASSIFENIYTGKGTVNVTIAAPPAVGRVQGGEDET